MSGVDADTTTTSPTTDTHTNTHVRIHDYVLSAHHLTLLWLSVGWLEEIQLGNNGLNGLLLFLDLVQGLVHQAIHGVRQCREAGTQTQEQGDRNTNTRTNIHKHKPFAS